MLYHTWVFGANCDPDKDQTANIEVACFGIEGMKKQVETNNAYEAHQTENQSNAFF